MFSIIAGGTLGALALFALVFFLILPFYRRVVQGRHNVQRREARRAERARRRAERGTALLEAVERLEAGGSFTTCRSEGRQNNPLEHNSALENDHPRVGGREEGEEGGARAVEGAPRRGEQLREMKREVERARERGRGLKRAEALVAAMAEEQQQQRLEAAFWEEARAWADVTRGSEEGPSGGRKMDFHFAEPEFSLSQARASGEFSIQMTNGEFANGEIANGEFTSVAFELPDVDPTLSQSETRVMGSGSMIHGMSLHPLSSPPPPSLLSSSSPPPLLLPPPPPTPSPMTPGAAP